MATQSRAVLKTGRDSGTILPAASYQNLIDSTFNLNDDQICEEFSTSTPYRLGKLVIYDNALYRAKEYITPSSTFNASKFKKLAELSDILAAYDEYQPALPYVLNDKVTWLNKLWKAVDAVPAGEAPTIGDDTYWVEVSRTEGVYIGTFDEGDFIGQSVVAYEGALYRVDGTRGEIVTTLSGETPVSLGWTLIAGGGGSGGTSIDWTTVDISGADFALTAADTKVFITSSDGSNLVLPNAADVPAGFEVEIFNGLTTSLPIVADKRIRPLDFDITILPKQFLRLKLEPAGEGWINLGLEPYKKYVFRLTPTTAGDPPDLTVFENTLGFEPAWDDGTGGGTIYTTDIFSAPLGPLGKQWHCVVAYNDDNSGVQQARFEGVYSGSGSPVLNQLILMLGFFPSLGVFVEFRYYN